ncbi:hypothetical protein B0H16DRAFT_658990 [Mycena metata]|uniref:Uncharacterized protein n=1 Tax=Mycena metata TaxID=1033252 RepID=A0AAD7J683_9AGAR|nr:hypothetical protein B0H16DRAFT_658990 [Mycena metata]
MADAFSHTINADQATFLGFALEALFYGSYLIVFGIAISVLAKHRPATIHTRKPILAVTCLMFSLCTTHFSLNFNNVYNGLMVHPRPHISEETHLLAGADMLFSITDWCSQLILIYRCYLVWGRNIWIVILPILISLATVSCGLALIGLVLSINPTAPQAPAALVPVGTAAFALSLVLNLLVSLLIILRIHLTARQNRLHGISHSDSAVARATGIIVESGLLFLAVQFVFVVLFAIGHPAQAVLVPVATQVYGISPTLIIVRVWQGAAYEARTQTTSSTRLSGLRFAGFARGVAVRGVAVSGRGRGGGRRSSLQRHSERAAHDKDLAPDLEMSRTRKEDHASSSSLHLPTSRKSMDLDSNGSLHLPTPRKSVESNSRGDVEGGRGSL